MRLAARLACGFVVVVLASGPSWGDPIAVRHVQGATRGFLVVRSEAGKVIASGELSQSATGDVVTSKLTFLFLDGSVDEDTTVFRQRGTFQLISEHHVQRGPFFDKASDVTVDVPKGMVTIKTKNKEGKEEVESGPMEMPADVANGLAILLVQNVARDVAPFQVSLVAPTGKGRLVKLAIAPDGEQPFHVAGRTRKATIFRVHVDLRGVAGVVAPVIGKEPKDTMIWLLEGDVPALVRVQAQMFVGGPMVSVELVGTSFQHGGM
jgi:hypothetical protein